VETTTGTCYVKSSGIKVVSGGKVEYYYCNRTGHYEADTKGMRAIKSQGTAKIDSYCTAKIILHHSGKNGSLKADITTTHYGHTISIGHLRLSKQQRLNIAGQLLQGVSFDSILDQVRNNIGTKLERIDLLMKKDLYNIERAFRIRGCERHSNDYISIQLWVQEMRSKCEDNPVLFLSNKVR
jgi:hypothetical protein